MKFTLPVTCVTLCDVQPFPAVQYAGQVLNPFGLGSREPMPLARVAAPIEEHSFPSPRRDELVPALDDDADSAIVRLPEPFLEVWVDPLLGEDRVLLRAVERVALGLRGQLRAGHLRHRWDD